eukprot:CAMPEP_0184649760 /NCGR_PEP_ID=MMETSP0308-20130426/7176_1 /TAXON_ID=38269 /ORGANISM="Gloeochaete witrockiana, Strain SAG 46.84" /LENGTH=449 /DNA_ID=CAMNT_0027082737 /DNA_START=36 /DNA_END=1385 /DNA_ORIENTATION=-
MHRTSEATPSKDKKFGYSHDLYTPKHPKHYARRFERNLSRLVRFLRTPPAGDTIRERIWLTIEDPHDSGLAFAVGAIFMATTILSIVSFVLQSLPDYVDSVPFAYYLIDLFCLGIFSVQFLLRLISCPSLKMFFFNVYTYIDIISIATLIVSTIMFESQYEEQALLRLVRLVRLVRLTRFFDISNVLGETLRRSALMFTLLLYYLLMAVILYGSIMYFLERGTWDPSSNTWMVTSVYGDYEESEFNSIPSGMWYTIVTLATVGYGDIYPVTEWGRLFGSFVVVSGYMVIGLPINAIGSAFTEVFDEFHEQKKKRHAHRNASRPKRRWLLRHQKKVQEAAQALVQLEHSQAHGPPPDMSIAKGTEEDTFSPNKPSEDDHPNGVACSNVPATILSRPRGQSDCWVALKDIDAVLQGVREDGKVSLETLEDIHSRISTRVVHSRYDSVLLLR